MGRGQARTSRRVGETGGQHTQRERQGERAKDSAGVAAKQGSIADLAARTRSQRPTPTPPPPKKEPTATKSKSARAATAPTTSRNAGRRR